MFGGLLSMEFPLLRFNFGRDVDEVVFDCMVVVVVVMTVGVTGDFNVFSNFGIVSFSNTKIFSSPFCFECKFVGFDCVTVSSTGFTFDSLVLIVLFVSSVSLLTGTENCDDTTIGEVFESDFE